jgi:alpha-2-macroglobulin
MSALKTFFTSTPFFIGATVAAIAAASVFYYQKASSKPSMLEVDPAFAKYVSSFTTGLVSAEGKIRVTLAQNVLDSVKAGQSGAEELFDFSPSVAGTAVWLDQRTVEFSPTSKLGSGTFHEVRFDLAKVADVKEENLRSFAFGFRVIPQYFELQYEGLRTSAIDPKHYRYEGKLVSADVADQVEALLSAKQNDKPLKITWQHDADRKTHRFAIQDIERQASKSLLKIAYNGQSQGVDKTEERTIEIPASNSFEFLEALVMQEPQQAIHLLFSDPLKADKNLAGLLFLNGSQVHKYAVEGNVLKLFPSYTVNGTATLLFSGIENVNGQKITEQQSVQLNFEAMKPSVRLVGKGIIVPSTNGVVLPFEAVGLKAVQVRVLKIFENNIVQFLQSYGIENQADWRVGKPVLQKTIYLGAAKVADYSQWKRYYLDLSELVKTEPGAIYQVTFSISKKHAIFPCKDSESSEQGLFNFEEDQKEQQLDQAAFEEGNYYYPYYSYNYEKREDPCTDDYYRNFNNEARYNLVRNVLASDLGIVAKLGANKELVAVVSDLRTAQPLDHVEIEIYDAQQQLVGKANTNSDGIAIISSQRKPFALVAKKDSQRGYLKLNDGTSLSLSSFDVTGSATQKGIKGFLYGERGVWRPGDSLFVTFVLENRTKDLPKNHPILFSLYNPLGQLAVQTSQLFNYQNTYTFRTATDPTSPTGEWRAEVKVGGAEFSKSIRIETVKPNRLKLSLDFGANRLTALQSSIQGKLQAQWLTGATASGLKAKYDAVVSTGKTTFDQFKDYTFDDPMTRFEPQELTIFEGYLDGNGKATVNTSFELGDVQAPGALNVTFKGKVFEQGGDFSVDNFTMPYFPYTSYVGVLPPAVKSDWDYLATNQNHTVLFASVDANGKPRPLQNIKVEVYKLDWRWWWEQDGNDNSEYTSSESQQLITSAALTTEKNGLGKWTLNIKGDEWGRFYIKATDPVSGHVSGKVVYVDSPYGNHSSEQGGLTRLQFFPDQEKYNVGEKVKLSFPSNASGRALVSLENGTKVLKTFWVNGMPDKTVVEFEATADMSPNVYAHIHFIQPHQQKNNDLPIRLYGVCPVMIENPATKLEPVITMPDVLRPEQTVSITVAEKTGKPMSYTIAVVDEGLLDLTRFKTPDPWKYFYAREALGVKTWDVYDLVLGAYGGELERLLSIGGDEEIAPSKNADKGNALRFKPVVKFMGPFVSDGKAKSHTFKMPNYVGSVRTMVVASNPDFAYGSADKTTPVKNPLMVVATLPRVLGPDEEVKLPVNVFAMEKGVDNVSITVQTNDFFTVVGNTTSTLHFTKPGDQLCTFNLKVKPKLGQGKVTVTAVSGNHRSTQEIDIKVRVPNPYVSNVQEQIIEPGQSWAANYVPAGMAGTNRGTVEISSMPPINLEQRLAYLIHYPHGCIEQTTSSVFPQLFLTDLMQLDDATKTQIQQNVTAGIQRLRNFQTVEGGFAYWPGETEPSEWGSNYAGHFLLEAQARGYEVPADLLAGWLTFQQQRTQMPRSREYDWQRLELSYRLYTLAVAGKPDLSAMNRMKETSAIAPTAAWRLAATYLLAGQTKVAQEMIQNLPTQIANYRELDYTYGSDERDKAMMLETLLLMGEKTKALPLLTEIAQSLSNPNEWMSTQTTAYCLLSIAKFAGSQKQADGISYTYSGTGIAKKTVKTDLAMSQNVLSNANVGKSLSIQNTGKTTLYARIMSEGIPVQGDPTEVANNLNMKVVYKTMKGKVLEPANIAQGTDFMAEVTISHPGTRGEYRQMALTQIFPSGWEISNTRMEGTEQFYTASTFDYQDIRDDRVYTYFSLQTGETKTYRILLNAAYTGRFYLPSTSCEAMYDHDIQARKPGKWVNVVKGEMVN